MLVESTTGNIFEDPNAALPSDVDWLDLNWSDCRVRAARKTTRGGRDVKILLRVGKTLCHGDVMGQTSDGHRIVVNILPSDVLVVRPRDLAEWVALAYQLGDLHVPVEQSENHLITPANFAIEAILFRLAIPFTRQKLRFQPGLWPQSVRVSEGFQIIRKVTTES